MDKRIIMCAPNGARRTKQDHPKLPITPEELAQCADEVADAGASILHLHVRDGAGGHSLDTGLYSQAVSAVNERVGDGLILQVTSEAVGVYTAAEQAEMVKSLKPEAVSIAVRELFPDGVPMAQISEFCRWMAGEGVWPQFILYDDGDISRFIELHDAGVLHQQTPFVLKVIGQYGQTGRTPTTKDFKFSKIMKMHGCEWAVCGFGAAENSVTQIAVSLGGHVRVGFENNLVMANGRKAKSNQELVSQTAEIMSDLDFEVMAAADVRKHFFS
jgi:3-keto-5-aminohexanoate cleavage enzyme